ETVRILWSQPFRLLYTCNYQNRICGEEKRKLQAENLLLTYLSCALYYQHNEELVNIISKPVTKPLFNYVQFLQNLDLHEFFTAIRDCTESKRSEHEDEADDYNDFINILCKLFMNHSTGLCKLSIDVDCITRGVRERACESLQSKNLCNYYQTITKSIGSNNCLSQLTELIMPSGSVNKTELLSALIPVSRNLKKIVVRVDYRVYHWCYNGRIAERPYVEQEAISLAGLIMAQKSLVYLGLCSCAEGLEYLLASIESQADTLKYLSFERVYFYDLDLFKHMAPLRNLEQIQFNHCTFEPKNDSKPFLYESRFPKLVKLEMRWSSGADYVVEILRSAANGCLNVETEPHNSIFDLEYW
ncbi:2800_t:CDS:1, partial [Acaulospora morrowiae]